MVPVPELSNADLTHVLDHTRHVWNDYRDARVFITGVTGFVGSWLLETLLHAENTLHLGIKATVLVRDKSAFVERLPHLAASPLVRVHVGDVRIVDPPTHAFTHFVHCASAATPRMNAEKPDEVLDIIENGSERMIEEAMSGKDVRFLQVSSGSVYGPQPDSLERIAESHPGTASSADPAQRFGAAKRKAEMLGAAAVKKGVGFVAARMFALVGPRLPLDGQFAIGNFFADALAGRTVDLNSDGTAVRSWMHAADMAAWSWTLLARGRAGVGYNVGSEEAYSLWDAAHKVAQLPTPPVAVTRAKEPVAGVPAQRYVPSVAMARDELGLEPWIPLDDALARTWSWLKQ
jgi:dTDP-glucose 4,6-dehydratase